MTATTFDGLRDEMTAAIEVLEPQLRGLQDLEKASLSDTTRTAVTLSIGEHEQRLSLLHSVLKELDDLEHAINNLENDGYPAGLVMEVDKTTADELQGQQADYQAAFGQFELAALATTMTITLGDSADKA